MANFGALALQFTDAADHDRIARNDVLVLDGIREAPSNGTKIHVRNTTRDEVYSVCHELSTRQIEMLLVGGLIPWLRSRIALDAAIPEESS